MIAREDSLRSRGRVVANCCACSTSLARGTLCADLARGHSLWRGSATVGTEPVRGSALKLREHAAPALRVGAASARAATGAIGTHHGERASARACAMLRRESGESLGASAADVAVRSKPAQQGSPIARAVLPWSLSLYSQCSLSKMKRACGICASTASPSASPSKSEHPAPPIEGVCPVRHELAIKLMPCALSVTACANWPPPPRLPVQACSRRQPPSRAVRRNTYRHTTRLMRYPLLQAA